MLFNNDRVISSIIIPVFNKLEYTIQCLKALFKVTPIKLFELIIVNNASTDGTKEFLEELKEKYPAAKVIHNEENLGFAKACNQGAKIAEGRFLLFLNNDTIPLQGWLEALIESTKQNVKIGICGSRLSYPNNLIQHAGIAFNEYGIPYHVYRYMPSEHPMVTIKKYYPAVTGACLLIRRDLFEEIGGFDEKYGMYVEDIDLCLKCWSKGFRVIYVPESHLVHFESVSVEDTKKKDDMVRKGWNRLIEKWKNVQERIKSEVDNANKELGINTVSILWSAPIFDPSGYAEEARNFVLRIGKKIPIKVNLIGRFSEFFFQNISSKEKSELLGFVNGYNEKPYINIIHFPAYIFKRDPNASYNIGRVVYETDSLPLDWVVKCNAMDEIWTASQFNVESFKKAGVKVPIYKIPEGIDTNFFSPNIPPLSIPRKRGFVFLSVFEWLYRKGWDLLLKAWVEAFSQKDDVCLVLRTYPPNVTEGREAEKEIWYRINQFLGKLGVSKKEIAPIIVLAEQIPLKYMPSLYKFADAYVMPSRGEGWGRPYMEAMAVGLPTIGTRWGGNLEFMNDENSYLIDVEELEIIDEKMELAFYRGQYWAKPSVQHLAEIMRYVYERRDEAKKRGDKARRDIKKKWDWDTVTEIALKRLGEIANSITSSTTSNKLYIRWEGSQFVYHSLALINREICIQLIKLGHELSIIPYEPHQFGPEIDARFRVIAERFGKPLPKIDVHVRHQWPPNFNPPAMGHWVIIQPWEYGSLPKSWVKPLNHLIDEIWVPSNYVKKSYIYSGVSRDKIFVIPNGVNTQVFNPYAFPLPIPTKKRFKFLFVGGTIWRKGIDILLEVFTETFNANDDVALVIKDIGQDSFYKHMNYGEKIKKIQANEQSPEIIYIQDKLTEQEMAGLYVACDCLVHPYRGEGFAMPVLEAMACELPVIVTKGGATDDFCKPEWAYTIPARWTLVPFGGDELVTKFARMLEPNKNALKVIMKYVIHNYGEAKHKAQLARNVVYKYYTWEKIGKKVEQRIKLLMNKPIVRFRKG
ncbi:MAG: glycosyltransferase [Deltaproteobacteria bacterium]|nr:glycosyltransferase [Deltaproteobacteria bacterium]MBW2068414.1 glycosyltransferase [Deltaproteobacteria bacterium]